MNPANKERESSQLSVDETALKEVEGYIERIEKKTENLVDKSGLSQSGTVSQAPTVTDDMGKTIMAASKMSGKQRIVLPLDEEEIRKGLHHKMIDAVRWLAEWSVYIIKKYPGRVFYRTNK